jgi:hypothetical protein
LACGVASGDIVTGTYTFGGLTLPTNQTGPWFMKANSSTYSVLRFVPDTPLSFASYTSLIYNYNVTLGGIGGGSPRATVELGSGDTFDVQWGPAGSYVDGTIGSNLSTGNLLSLTDVGRYDTSHIAGGSPFTDRSSAVALIGSQTVTQIDLIIDAFVGMPGGAFKGFLINSVNVEATAAVPESNAFWLVAMLSSVLGVAVVTRHAWRSRKLEAAA